MPTRASRACTYPGCGVITANGRCAKHARPAWRKNVRDRFYDTPFWRKLRKRIIERDPVCKLCGKKPSRVAGHIIARRDGGSDEEDNLRGECWDCSNKNTRREQLARAAKSSEGVVRVLRKGVSIVVDE